MVNLLPMIAIVIAAWLSSLICSTVSFADQSEKQIQRRCHTQTIIGDRIYCFLSRRSWGKFILQHPELGFRCGNW
jgi:hypothetical protein